MNNWQEEDLLWVSGIEHYSYCPRQWALIYLEQAFSENEHTMRGQAVHKLVDEVGSELHRGVRIERALPLYSQRLGLVGKADVVEFHPNGIIFPVEYKHGTKRAKQHDALQLCAQAVCLEEMTGKPVTQGALYYHRSRRRLDVEISVELRQDLEVTIAAIRALTKQGNLPPPVNDKRCNQCSLNHICQPQASAAQNRLLMLRTALFEEED